MITMTKAYSTKIALEAAMIARECMGGNGILIENKVIKMVMDLHTAVSGEGSYEMNIFVAGKELTGLQAYM